MKTVEKVKKILIESETTETVRLKINGPQTSRLYCQECDAVEEMLELNSAADVTGIPARDVLELLAKSVLHSPETTTGHLLICRASLELAINADSRLRPAPMLLKESL